MAHSVDATLGYENLCLIYVAQLSIVTEKLSNLVIQNIGALNDHLETVQNVFERVDRRKIYVDFCEQYDNVHENKLIMAFIHKMKCQNEIDYLKITEIINEKVRKTEEITKRLRALKERRSKIVCEKRQT